MREICLIKQKMANILRFPMLQFAPFLWFTVFLIAYLRVLDKTRHFLSFHLESAPQKYVRLSKYLTQPYTSTVVALQYNKLLWFSCLMVMDSNSTISWDGWIYNYCQGRWRVKLLFQGDQWGHGNSNDHFLWSKALEVKGQYRQLPMFQTRAWASNLGEVSKLDLKWDQSHWNTDMQTQRHQHADAQPNLQLNSIKTRQVGTPKAQRLALCLAHVSGHCSNLQPQLPGVRASSALGPGEDPSLLHRWWAGGLPHPQLQ